MCSRFLRIGRALALNQTAANALRLLFIRNLCDIFGPSLNWMKSFSIFFCSEFTSTARWNEKRAKQKNNETWLSCRSKYGGCRARLVRSKSCLYTEFRFPHIRRRDTHTHECGSTENNNNKNEFIARLEGWKDSHTHTVCKRTRVS